MNYLGEPPSPCTFANGFLAMHTQRPGKMVAHLASRAMHFLGVATTIKGRYRHRLMKLLIVDDHALFREGIALLLASLEQDVSVLEAPSCEAALEVIAQCGDI